MSVINKSDNELIEEIKKESNTALKILLRRYSPRLKFYIVHSFSLPEFEAEDIIQNAFIKFFLNISKYSFKYEFTTYIYTLVRNESLSIKRFFKKSFSSVNETTKITNDSGNNNFDINDCVSMLLKKLNNKERQIIYFREIEELSYDEISKITKTKLGTLKSLHSRTIAKLRTIIDNADLRWEDFFS